MFLVDQVMDFPGVTGRGWKVGVHGVFGVSCNK
jgi:hypothetical protein